MQKKDLFVLKVALEAVSDLPGVKFAYAVAKNLQIVSRELEALLKSAKPSDDYLKMDRERLALCEKYAKKEDSGKPVIQGESYVIEDKKRFDLKLAKLRKQHQDVIDGRDSQMKEYEQLLEEPIEITFHKISKEILPENITGKQIHGIIDILDEDEPAKKDLKVVK